MQFSHVHIALLENIVAKTQTWDCICKEEKCKGHRDSFC